MNRKRSSFLGSTFARVATVALVLMALACDSGTQEPAAPEAAAPEATTDSGTPAETGADVPAPVAREGDIDSSRFPTEMPEGATAAVPDNFPSDVPIYPGAQAAQGKGIEIEGSPQSAVQFLTNDAFADVHRYYADELAGKGWTIDSDTGNEVSAMMEATKGTCKASVLINAVDGGGSDIFVVTWC